MTDSNRLAASCLTSHRPIVRAAIASTDAVDRLGLVDRKASLGIQGRIASGRSVEGRPCHLEPEHTGLGRDHLGLDIRWVGVMDEHHSVGKLGLARADRPEPGHRLVALVQLGVLAHPRPCVRSPPPSCVPSTPFGSP